MLVNSETFAMVIKSAIVIESEIEEIFSAVFANPKHLFDLKLNYEHKIALVLSLGLDDRFKPPLGNLATLRNKFAHRLDVGFGMDEAKNFYSTFDAIDQSHMKYEYANFGGKPFEELPPEDLFIICIVTLRAAILAASQRLKAKPVT